MTSPRVLTLRELNRTTLARQLLLERAGLPAVGAVEHLAGLQAQAAISPYVALWSRLTGFQRDDLAGAIAARRIVKATSMRATLHLLSAEDYVNFHPTLQPVLAGAQAAIARARGEQLDVANIVDEAQAYIAATPRTFAEISDHFAARYPGVDIGAIRYTIRTQLPLVQVPVESGWSYPGNPQFTLATTWLGRAPGAPADLPQLIRRYLAAFGPATVADFQGWSGLGKIKPVMESLRSELAVYRDDTGRELFDLPGMPLPAATAPAPVRLLPEFDSLLLAHARRERVIADVHRSQVYLPGLRVRATFLVDGFVRGGWKIERSKKSATLVLEPFAHLDEADRTALVDEASRLLRFAAADVSQHDVQLTA